MENLEYKFEAIKYNTDRNNENPNYDNEGTVSTFDYIYTLVEQDLISMMQEQKIKGQSGKK